VPNIFSIIFRLRANYSPLLSLRKTSLSLQPITTLHFLSHNVATPWKNKQKLSEMRPKTSHVLRKISHVFGKISHVFQEMSDVFLLSLEEMKTKLRYLFPHQGNKKAK